MEEAGIPAVGITFEDMRAVAEQYKRQIGMPDMRNIIIPRMTAPEKSRVYAPELVPKLVAALTAPLTDEEKSAEPIPAEDLPRIVFTGTWDECQEYFHGDAEWEAVFSKESITRLTVGLPVVLPTEEKVKRVLTGTSHKPDEVIGPVPVPADQKALTVETVAINAVMAGCKPEYMPVLLAMAELMTTPARTRVSARKGGAHRLLGVVSGPIARELKMCTEYFGGEDNRPAFSMRHAMHLIGRNAIGFWDQFGSGFFAENIWDSPWTPLGVDAGFKRGENVFSLSVANNPNTDCVSPARYRAEGQFLERLVPAIQNQGNILTATIIIHPSVANDLAAKGMSKEDVKQWLWENTTETMGHYRQRPWYGVLNTMQRREGPFNRADIFDLPDDAVMHTLKSPEMIQIIVAGIPMEFGYVAVGPMWLPPEMMTSIDKWR